MTRPIIDRSVRASTQGAPASRVTEASPNQPKVLKESRFTPVLLGGALALAGILAVFVAGLLGVVWTLVNRNSAAASRAEANPTPPPAAPVVVAAAPVPALANAAKTSTVANSPKKPSKPAPPTARPTSPPDSRGAGSSRRIQSVPQTPPLTAMVERTTASMALVKGKLGHGSGFAVLPDVIATNAHVIWNELIEDITVQFVAAKGAHEETYQVELLYEDKARDLALLHTTSRLTRAPLETNPSFDPTQRKTVYVIGNPGQAEDFARINKTAACKADDLALVRNQSYFLLRAPTSKDLVWVGPGNSGGPVVDEMGRVIGILTRGIMEVDGRAQGRQRPTDKVFALPANVLQTALDRLGPPAEWKQKTTRATTNHLLDIVLIQTELTMQICRSIYDARYRLAQRSSPFFVARSGLDGDQELIDLFKDVDRDCRDQSKQALKNLSATHALAADKRQKLNDSLGVLEDIRRVLVKPRVNPNETKRCKRNLDECDQNLRDLEKLTGITREIIADMSKAIASQVKNIKIVH